MTGACVPRMNGTHSSIELIDYLKPWTALRQELLLNEEGEEGESESEKSFKSAESEVTV